MKKVSVIVPIYNVENYIDKCIESLVNQTYKNIEIILVDDGSSDNSPALCDEWSKKDGRIIVIHKTNGGVSSARNAGIDNATGDYIQFLDGDDYLNADTIEYSVKTAEENDADIVSFGMQMVSDGKIVNSWTNENGSYVIDAENDYYKLFFEVMCNNFLFHSSCAKLMKTSIIKDNNLSFDTRHSFAEDFQFTTAYMSYCKRITLIKECFYNYVVDRESSNCYVVHKEHKYRIDGNEKICYYIYEDLKKNAFLQNLNKVFPYMYSMIMYGCLYAVMYDGKGYCLHRYIKKIENIERFKRNMRYTVKNFDALCNEYGRMLYSKGEVDNLKYMANSGNVKEKLKYLLKNRLRRIKGWFKNRVR